MNDAEKNRLFDALEQARWSWRDGALYAPNGTMWLDGADPWNGDLRSFRDRMVGRVERIQRNLQGSSKEDADDNARALVDAAALVEVLNTLLK